MGDGEGDGDDLLMKQNRELGRAAAAAAGGGCTSLTAKLNLQNSTPTIFSSRTFD